MRIFVINPNTSESVTEHLRRELTKIKRPDTELTVVNPEHGPVSIESVYDEALAGPPTLELVQRCYAGVETIREGFGGRMSPLDCSKAGRLLGFRPRYTWQMVLENSGAA